MRSLDEHLQHVLRLVAAVPTRRESVPVALAAGRVSASRAIAVTPSPPFDNSAMDGFAVRSADTARAPSRLSVVGQSLAGHPAAAAVTEGTAIRVTTGAQLPGGADAVVAQELVRELGGAIVLAEPVPHGRHVRRRAEDVATGDEVFGAGIRLSARHAAAAASAGLSLLDVAMRARVAVLVTGDELVPPGQRLAPGQIHDSNAVYLEAALRAVGAVPVLLGPVGDDPDAVRAAVEDAAASGAVDLVVTTGGASIGPRDPVKAGLAASGVAFAPVAMQPGKPQGIGVVDGVPVLCLPGNPVAVAVSFEVFVAPAVRALHGESEPAWEVLHAGADWVTPPGREQLMPVVITGDVAQPATAGGSGSHLVARLAAAQGLARVAADVERVRTGDTVLVRRFTP